MADTKSSRQGSAVPERFQLDVQAQAVLDRFRAQNLPRPTSLPPVQARQAYRSSRAPTQPKLTAATICRDLQIPAPHGALGLRAYRPSGSQATKVLPALIYFHGGGWVIGDLDTHDVLCRNLCEQAACAVFSVDYRLAPEHPFPAAVDDAVCATRWLISQADSLFIDAGKVAVGGDSAGGNLAAVVALAMRADPGPGLAAQLLIYPVTDIRAQTPSCQAMREGYSLSLQDMHWFRGHYLQTSQYAQWRASPLLATDLRGLPSALVLTAGYDPLHDEGRLYADALSAAGNAVQYVDFARQMHGFIGMGGVIDEANTAVTLCATWLRSRLG